MNTVLAAVEWSLVEPVEGKFNFSVVDELLSDARKNDLKLILLWFGSWKNGQSHYMPEWVKKDFKQDINHPVPGRKYSAKVIKPTNSSWPGTMHVLLTNVP